MTGDRRVPGEAGRRGFATTRWSLVVAAGRGDPDASRVALAELCAEYWSPLYAFARRRGHAPEDARDLTQAFFAKLLEKGDIGAADPARGRFRTFLLSSMQNFLSGEWRKNQTLKRGGAVTLLPLDFDSAEESYRREPAHHLTPEALYHRRWALELLQRAAGDLRKDYARAGRSELFEALKGSLGGEEEVLPYAELSKRFGKSEVALRTAASRLRSRWGKRLRELVAETVGTKAEIGDELKRLIASLEPGV